MCGIELWGPCGSAFPPQCLSPAPQKGKFQEQSSLCERFPGTCMFNAGFGVRGLQESLGALGFVLEVAGLSPGSAPCPACAQTSLLCLLPTCLNDVYFSHSSKKPVLFSSNTEKKGCARISSGQNCNDKNPSLSGSERDEISKIKHPDQENLNTMQPIRNCTCKLAEAHVMAI